LLQLIDLKLVVQYACTQESTSPVAGIDLLIPFSGPPINESSTHKKDTFFKQIIEVRDPRQSENLFSYSISTKVHFIYLHKKKYPFVNLENYQDFDRIIQEYLNIFV
jgi:hypothetical protein